MTTGATGNQLKLRLFLEGIEVPVIGAQVQLNLNAPATASIQVVPTDLIMDLKPRTMVHLFFWDYTKDLPDSPPLFGIDNSVTSYEENVVDGQDSADPNIRLDNYKLLFGGEVTGLVMAKNATGRQAVLQCADWSTYWDTSYQTFISYSPNGNFLSDRSSMWSGGNNMFNNILNSHAGVMGSYLRRQPKSEGLQHIRGLMGGVISLLEAMGGVPQHTSGINDYFTIAELKNHILQQITAEQNDDTARRLYSAKSFSAWLNSRLTSLGELVSFRDMLKLLFHWIYYEVVPVSCPYYVPAVTGSTKSLPKNIRTRDTRDLNQTQIQAIQRLIRVAKRFDGSQGVDKAIENQSKINEERAALVIRDELEKLLSGDGTVAQTVQTPGGGTKTRRIRKVTLTTGFTARAKKSIDAAITATEGMKNVNPRGDVNTQYRKNQRSWARITNALFDLLGLKGRAARKSTSKRRKAQVDRLQTQIFRPDCFFVPPPRCNVLFPDQYMSFQFQRNFLQEVTRLRLTTGLQFISGKGAGFFNHSHFAPAMSEVKRLAKSQGNRGIRTLLPWEKHTGILPKFEHISEINYQANKRQRKLTKDVKGQAKSYAQRAANFNFIKYRFAPRTISVNAKFNPFFAPGFPALIIDKPFIIDPADVDYALLQAGVETKEIYDLSTFIANIGPLAQYFQAPKQYLGMPASVSHVVDQSGGITSMTLTHARQHRITDDDFLQVWAAEVSRKKTTQVRSTVLDAQELLAKGDYKNLRALIDSTPQSILEDMERGLPQFAQPESTSGADSATPGISDELGKRVTGEPTLDLPALAPFLVDTSDAAELLVGSRNVNIRSFLSRDLDELEGEELEYGGTEFVRLRGGTTTKQFEGKTITIPSKYGVLSPTNGRARGPIGGKVVEIQVLGDSVIQIGAADLSSFVRSRRERNAIQKRPGKGKGKDKTFFLWRRAVIWEEVKSKTVKPIPIEESLRPPWFSPLYSNLYIGPQIYQNFFGTGSIVDQSLFVTPEGNALFSQSAERKNIEAQLTAADGDPVKISQILEDNAGKVLSEVPSIETSVDALAFIYGEVRRQNLDVQRFIANYTARPIATMRNMMGSLDLEYEQNGNTLELVSGQPGFHSSAIAPFGQLLGLVDNPDTAQPRIRSRGPKFPISRDLDPRPERRKAVQDYAEQVSASRGSLGTGLLG